MAVFRATKYSRAGTGFAAMIGVLLIAIGAASFSEPGVGLSGTITMTACGLIFVAIGAYQIFGRIRVDSSGVYLRVWGRRRFVPAGQVEDIVVAPTRPWFVARNTIFLVTRDGKRTQMSLQIAYDTSAGRAWIEGHCAAMLSALRAPSGASAH